MSIGIVSYGSYVPRLRLSRAEYLKAWGSCGADIKDKAVMDFDEDTLTMAVEAAKEALGDGTAADKVGIICLASTRFPYEEKVMSSTAGEILGLPGRLLATEHGQSTRAGSEAFITAASLLQNDQSTYAMVLVADAPQADVKETLDHGLGAGAAAFILGKENLIAEIEQYNSFVSESMGERYRLEGGNILRDIGVRGFTSAAYKKTVSLAVKDMLELTNSKASDYRYLVLQETDGKSAKSIAKSLGFSDDQISPGLLYGQIGDTGASSTMLSLAAVLDQAQLGDRIMLASYGSGAGSQAISLKVVAPIKHLMSVNDRLQTKKSIDYIGYLKLKRQIL